MITRFYNEPGLNKCLDINLFALGFTFMWFIPSFVFWIDFLFTFRIFIVLIVSAVAISSLISYRSKVYIKKLEERIDEIRDMINREDLDLEELKNKGLQLKEDFEKYVRFIVDNDEIERLNKEGLILAKRFENYKK